MFYDEQPTTFKQSWNQRMRWTKGFYQVLFKYGKNLFKTMFKEKRMFVSCYDMIMTLAPATLFTLGTILLNLVLLYNTYNRMEENSCTRKKKDNVSFLFPIIHRYIYSYQYCSSIQKGRMEAYSTYSCQDY